MNNPKYQFASFEEELAAALEHPQIRAKWEENTAHFTGAESLDERRQALKDTALDIIVERYGAGLAGLR